MEQRVVKKRGFELRKDLPVQAPKAPREIRLAYPLVFCAEVARDTQLLTYVLPSSGSLLLHALRAPLSAGVVVSVEDGDYHLEMAWRGEEFAIRDRAEGTHITFTSTSEGWYSLLANISLVRPNHGD